MFAALLCTVFFSASAVSARKTTEHLGGTEANFVRLILAYKSLQEPLIEKATTEQHRTRSTLAADTRRLREKEYERFEALTKMESE